MNRGAKNRTLFSQNTNIFLQKELQNMYLIQICHSCLMKVDESELWLQWLDVKRHLIRKVGHLRQLWEIFLFEQIWGTLYACVAADFG